MNKKIIKTIVSANVSTEKIIVVTFAIKAFMSFKLIQSPAKNLTSSTVCALYTINAKKLQPTINQTRAVTNKNVRI
ncbi:MAG: hypothetical protein LBQ59_00030 [Candidatus Peribacteria bacterium]|nr:hypothetical protein [Candidatus Peribacteria bacterium]